MFKFLGIMGFLFVGTMVGIGGIILALDGFISILGV